MTSPLQQKLKVTSPVVITANRLSDGVVIYRTSGGWTTDLGAAAVATGASDAKALLSAAMADDAGAVGAYVAPVAVSADGRIEPANLREWIRRLGPTIELPATPGLRAKCSDVYL